MLLTGLTALGTVGVIGIVVVFLIFSLWLRYRTVGADDAMIITGSYLGRKNVFTDDSGRKIKIVRGGGALILPIFQRVEKISLLSYKITVSTPEVYTEQGVPII